MQTHKVLTANLLLNRQRYNLTLIKKKHLVTKPKTPTAILPRISLRQAPTFGVGVARGSIPRMR